MLHHAGWNVKRILFQQLINQPVSQLIFRPVFEVKFHILLNSFPQLIHAFNMIIIEIFNKFIV